MSGSDTAQQVNRKLVLRTTWRYINRSLVAISDPNKSEALQLMSLPGRLCFTKDGQWRHDGVVVTHRQIARYFARHLEYSEEHGSYVIAVDGRCVSVAVEDTPWVVTSIDSSDTGPWQIQLNSGESYPLDPESLEIRAENVLYCKVKGGTHLLRLLRSAMQSIWPLIEEQNGSYYVLFHGQRFPILQR